MKKIRILILSAIFAFQFGFINANDWNLSVEPMFGMKHGELIEQVLLKKSEYSSDKLSELEWEYKPELYGGAKVSGGWRFILGEAFFSAGIPMKTGTTYDSDWQNLKHSGNDDYLYKTNYSESDNYLEHDISTGVKVGADFKVFKNDIIQLNVNPFLGFDYNNMSFTAKDGYKWYGKSMNTNRQYAYNDTDHQNAGKFKNTSANYDGRDIEYKRQNFITWIGFNATAKLPFNLSANLGFQVSPYIYTESVDYHVLTSTIYLDIAEGAFSAFKWNVGASYRINQRNSVSLSANWFYLNAITGNTYSKSYSKYKSDGEKFFKNEKSSTTDCGAGQFYFDLSLSWKFKIF